MSRIDPNPRRSPLAVRTLYVVQVAALLACAVDASPGSRPELAVGAHAGGEAGETSASGSPDAAGEDDARVYTNADAEARPDPAVQDAEASGSDASSRFDAGPARGAVRTTLVAPSLWRSVGPFDDPFEDGPELPRCSTAALMAEMLAGEPVFSVDTGECDYVTVSQSIQRAVAPGETIRVRLWHFELDAPEPAEAHAALRVDGLSILDERVKIPQPGGLIAKQLQLVRAIPEGALVHFHLHNHGANSWSLVEVSAGP
jgi:hypothetical protein